MKNESQTAIKKSPSVYFCPTRKAFEIFCQENGINPRHGALYIDRDEKALGLMPDELDKVVCFGGEVHMSILKSRGFTWPREQ